MRRSLQLVALCSLFLPACHDKEAEQHLTNLMPRLNAIYDKLRELEKALPAAGSEHEVACAPPLGPVELHALDEGALLDSVGAKALDPKQAREAHSLSGSALNVPSAAGLDRIRDDGAFGAQVEFLDKHLAASEKVTQVVVLRNQVYDSGQLNGKVIVRSAHWKGWAFVMSVAPAKLLGAWPMDVESADSIEGIVFDGRSHDLLTQSLSAKLGAATAAGGLTSCGIKAVLSSESQF